jgi:hypothetical protein
MIVEERIYILHPGKLGEFLHLYETIGLPIQQQVLPRMLGFFTSEIGTLNQVVHLWGYDSLEQRTRKRAEMRAYPGWSDYTARVRPLFKKQQNRLLRPTAWSPIR